MQQFVDYFLKNLYTIFYIYSQIHHAMTKIILKIPLLESEKAVLEKTALFGRFSGGKKHDKD